MADGCSRIENLGKEFNRETARVRRVKFLLSEVCSVAFRRTPWAPVSTIHTSVQMNLLSSANGNAVAKCQKPKKAKLEFKDACLSRRCPPGSGCKQVLAFREPSGRISDCYGVLRSPRATIGTAQTLFHRFYLFFPWRDFSFYVSFSFTGCVDQVLNHSV
jgi:hypothetical protein